MKNITWMQWFSLVVITTVFILSGCRKTESPVIPETQETIFDLQVSPEFDWKTMKTVSVNISGLSVPVKIRNTFYVKSVDGKAIYFNDLLEMDQNYTLRVTIPAYVTQMVASYGTISKTLDINGNAINFDYIVEQ
jgi:hypothetical protein